MDKTFTDMIEGLGNAAIDLGMVLTITRYEGGWRAVVIENNGGEPKFVCASAVWKTFEAAIIDIAITAAIGAALEEMKEEGVE